MKHNEKLERILIERFDRLEIKVDKVLEEKLPQLEKELAVSKQQAGVISTVITLVGGGLAVAFTWLKK